MVTIDEGKPNPTYEQDPTEWQVEEFNYTCPACNCSSLVSWFKFCPSCGVQIEWTGEAPDD